MAETSIGNTGTCAIFHHRPLTGGIRSLLARRFFEGHNGVLPHAETPAHFLHIFLSTPTTRSSTLLFWCTKALFLVQSEQDGSVHQ